MIQIASQYILRLHRLGCRGNFFKLLTPEILIDWIKSNRKSDQILFALALVLNNSPSMFLLEYLEEIFLHPHHPKALQMIRSLRKRSLSVTSDIYL